MGKRNPNSQKSYSSMPPIRWVPDFKSGQRAFIVPKNSRGIIARNI